MKLGADALAVLTDAVTGCGHTGPAALSCPCSPVSRRSPKPGGTTGEENTKPKRLLELSNIRSFIYLENHVRTGPHSGTELMPAEVPALRELTHYWHAQGSQRHRAWQVTREGREDTATPGSGSMGASGSMDWTNFKDTVMRETRA